MIAETHSRYRTIDDSLVDPLNRVSHTGTSPGIAVTRNSACIDDHLHRGIIAITSNSACIDDHFHRGIIARGDPSTVAYIKAGISHFRRRTTQITDGVFACAFHAFRPSQVVLLNYKDVAENCTEDAGTDNRVGHPGFCFLLRDPSACGFEPCTSTSAPKSTKHHNYGENCETDSKRVI